MLSNGTIAVDAIRNAEGVSEHLGSSFGTLDRPPNSEQYLGSSCSGYSYRKEINLSRLSTNSMCRTARLLPNGQPSGEGPLPILNSPMPYSNVGRIGGIRKGNKEDRPRCLANSRP
ncbi:unnamed protein product [Tuber aestivum]|uniref:Uncharacterized protein n=1 Tax=Tuber aestivum TaxID=59557 RepID=A0A292PXV7_9PEZI|nr:unnamed protein product [Tuber aestivum]